MLTKAVARCFSSRHQRLSTCGVLTVLAFGLCQASTQAAVGDRLDDLAAPVLVMVELEAPPTTHVYHRSLVAQGATLKAKAAATRVAQAHLGHLESTQRQLLSALTASPIRATQLYSLQRVYNGIAVQVAPSQLETIRHLPGVVAVHPLVPKVRVSSTSVPFVGTPTVWDGSGLGLTGDTISIGIIDTGVDYLHTDFGGSGLAADYAANDTTSNGDAFFPTAKVVGGFDFVGDAYDASNPLNAVPVPDPDPMDCEGHGTHVAGIAAGFGVLSDGSTYAGAYGPATPFGSLRIGPGVAPEAVLYALRVFGCGGTTAVVEEALEWAVDPDQNGDFSDHLDVVNLSLTSPYASALDPTAIAADNAALAGVIVVAAAGNDGDTHFITGSPAVADRAVSVAVMWDSDLFGVGARITAPPAIAGTHQASGAGFGPAVMSPGVSGEVVLAMPENACSPLSNAAAMAGKIALVARSASCTAVTQARNAQTAGAIAMLVANNQPGLTFLANDGTGGDITISSLLVRQRAGEAIQGELPGVMATLDRVLLGDMFAPFSSRGPRRAASPVVLKPDLAAPGVAILSAGMGNSVSGGKGTAIKSGTSMAAPHVAGLMALLRQLHPGWSVAQLKALAMNTTSNVYADPEHTPPLADPPQVGAGRIHVSQAALTGAIAYDNDAPERVGISFGHREVLALLTDDRVVEVRNLTVDPATYSVELLQLSDIPGVDFSLPDGDTLVVPALGTAELTVHLAAQASLMQHTHGETLDEATFGFDRHWMSEEGALLVLTPTAGSETVPLRVPIYAAARPAADMHGPSRLDVIGLTGTAILPLSGQEVVSGPSPPLDEISLVAPFELQQLLTLPDGTEPDRSQLAAIGVTTDFPAQPSGLSDSTIFFAIASHGPGSTPNTVRHEVEIDTDRDGTADFRLFNADSGNATFGAPTDAFISLLVNLGTAAANVQQPINALSPTAFHTVPHKSDVMILPVSTAALGLSPGSSRFDYQVKSFALGLDNATATGGDPSQAWPLPRPASTARPALAVRTAESAVLTFDPAAPGLDFTDGLPGFPMHQDLDGDSLPVAYDLPAFDANGSLALLLFHLHNQDADRVDAIGLRSNALPDLSLTLLASPEPALARGHLTYEVQVTNPPGTLTATNVVVQGALPPGALFEPALSNSVCSQMGGEVVCDLGSLHPGWVRIRRFTVSLPDLASGATVNFQATVTADEIDPNPLDNTYDAATTIGDLLFSDGFESGNLQAWSTKAP